MNWSGLGAEQSWRVGQKESGVLSVPLFLRDFDKLICEKIFCSRFFSIFCSFG